MEQRLNNLESNFLTFLNKFKNLKKYHYFSYVTIYLPSSNLLRLNSYYNSNSFYLSSSVISLLLLIFYEYFMNFLYVSSGLYTLVIKSSRNYLSVILCSNPFYYGANPLMANLFLKLAI